jgi:hypothetical protein
MIEFNDVAIEEIFGKEAAEDEAPTRLKEYFFRNKAYENVVLNLPLRILVGHKGIGKSALLKVSWIEDVEGSASSVVAPRRGEKPRIQHRIANRSY